MHLKKSAWRIFLALTILCVLLAEFFQHIITRSERGKAAYAQEQVLRLEEKIKEALGQILTFNTDSQFHRFFIHSGQQEQGFSFFYFENGVLVHWSDHELVLPENAATADFQDGTVLNLPNGIYSAYSRADGNRKITGLILLRKNFSYENKYLTNHFNPALGLDNRFVVTADSGDYQLKSSTGKILASLRHSPVLPDEQPFAGHAWSYLFAFFFFASSLIFFFLNRQPGIPEVILAGCGLFLLRYLMIYFNLPRELYHSDFFSPKVYGSSFFFNSTGDFLLNAVSFFVCAGIIYSRNRYRLFDSAPAAKTVSLLFAVFTLLGFLFYLVHRLVGGLVLNSKISFDIDLFAWDGHTLAAMLSILLLLWGCYILACGLLLPFRKWIPSVFSNLKFSRLQSGLAALFLLALYASVTINKNTRDKKLENQKLFAQRLEARQDQLAEYLFEDVQQRISRDTLIQKILTERTAVPERITRTLQQNYFTGYFTRFDADISVFDNSGVSFDPASADSLESKQEQFMLGRPTGSEKLSLQPDETGKLKYLSILPVADSSGNRLGVITVQLSSRTTQLPEGFPELLVSNTVVKSEDETGYSYARYSNGSLIYAGGNFPYAFHPSAFQSIPEDFSEITQDGYEHLVFSPSEGTLVIVSRPSGTFFDRLSLFSFVLLFFLLVFLTAHLFFYVLQNKNAFRLSLKQRIRSSIIFLVVISFVLIAAGTSVYIVRKYEADKNKNILASLNMMWFAITDRFAFEGGIQSEAKAQWNDELNNLVSNFNLDFNLYDEAGNLFYSSQPKLFEKGILGTRINPEALYEMRADGKTQFVHAESIGGLTYAAAYAPVTDRNGSVAGYLNLPYFEKQNELNKEISGFLSALINIYLLLLVVSLILALIITSRITKPLLLIQEKLGGLRLGSRNEMIEWQRDDEIGQLVRQYNKMVEALAESAEKLSRSERESAWREMAQQVAHEIKNPLTPMKLSVQHLQRAWNEKSGNLDELFQRISKTMIEQIDTLSVIASEFGNFAQMPRAKNETVDLNEMLRSAVNLFAATPGIEIHFSDDGIQRMVWGDREQLARAFSNLVKNAIQAIPENRKGVIGISVHTENNFHVVSIADNGTGIPAGLQSKIFFPSFTTKTSGTGLGLALVKSAIEMTGGTIRFETKEGEGSVFTVTIPSFQPGI